jgi:hypothetical protein
MKAKKVIMTFLDNKYKFFDKYEYTIYEFLKNILTNFNDPTTRFLIKGGASIKRHFEINGKSNDGIQTSDYDIATIEYAIILLLSIYLHLIN